MIRKISHLINYNLGDSSHDDYVRATIEDYDVLLLNPSWRVLPSIYFIEGKGPHVMTCREHDNGTSKLYIHPPRTPYHIIPSSKNDQLCHAVIKPRLIKPMKAMQYSNCYQMHEQKGSFQGLDCCDITNFGDFSYCSYLLDESESRTINYRPDINSLLDHLNNNGYLCDMSVSEMRKRAKDNRLSDDVVQSCIYGATYIDIYDAMKMKYEVGNDKNIKIIGNNNQQGTQAIIYASRNWLESIIPCQKIDADGYGSRFPDIPMFTYTKTDTMILWLLSGMMLCVKELWFLTSKCEIHVSKWHGWLLEYLTKKSFPGSIRNDK